MSLMRQGDANALHDIRVQARTMASVLKPFLELPHTKPVRRALEPLGSWMSKSNRVRDAEAQRELIDELLPEPYPKDVTLYLLHAQEKTLRKRAKLARAKSLGKLPRRIERLAKATDQCLGHMSSASLAASIGFACEALMVELRKDCDEGLQDRKRWHKARLRIKQLRYLIESYQDFLDPRYQVFVKETKLAQKNLGRLRDWLNLREVMTNEALMAHWLAGHAELEDELTHQAGTAMDFLKQKLASWD